jgi:hypothetical protein
MWQMKEREESRITNWKGGHAVTNTGKVSKLERKATKR